MHQEFTGHIQILFDGAPVEGVGLIFVTIRNSGNEPIRREDFDEPLCIRLGGTTQIISTEITRRIPPDLPVEFRLERTEQPSVFGQELTVAPLLLNSGDSMTIKLLITNYRNVEAVITGRILGISRFKALDNETFPWQHIVAIVLNVIGVSALVLLGARPRPPIYLLGAIVCITPFFALPYLAALFFDRRSRNASRSGNKS